MIKTDMGEASLKMRTIISFLIIFSGVIFFGFGIYVFHYAFDFTYTMLLNGAACFIITAGITCFCKENKRHHKKAV